MNSEDFGKFLLRALGETKGRYEDRWETWHGAEDITSITGQMSTGDMSSKKIHFTFLNISTLGHLKVTDSCAR